MITVKQFREGCMTPEKKKLDRVDPFIYLYRPVSYMVATPLVNLGVSATQASMMSLIVALLSCFVIAFSKTLGMRLLGGVLWYLWGVLDCVDGNIARYTHTTSAKGELWDAASGYLSLSGWPLAVGVTACFDSPNELLSLPIDPVYYIFIGGITSISILYPRLLMHKAFQGAAEKKKVLNGKLTYSFPKRVALVITNPCGVAAFIYMLSCVLHILNLFLLAYCALFVLICIVSSCKVFRDFKHDGQGCDPMTV